MADFSEGMNLNTPSKKESIQSRALPFPLDLFTPQKQQEMNIIAELLPSNNFDDVILQITREEDHIQQISISAIDPETMTVNPERDVWYRNVSVVSVNDLDLDGEPEIILDILARGMNCCNVIIIAYFDLEDQQYQLTNAIIRSWRVKPSLTDINQDGILEFVTQDLDYLYNVGGSSAIDTISPIQIFRYDEGQIVDNTRDYPYFVEQDAQFWLAALKGEFVSLDQQYLDIMHKDLQFQIDWGLDWGFTFEVVAAYLADMYTLGRGEEGLQTIEELCDTDHCQLRLKFAMDSLVEEGYTR
jgi:hypothetical protein